MAMRIEYEKLGKHLTMLVNGKYRIYDDGVVYNEINGGDSPQYVFKLRDKFLKEIAG